MSSQSQTADGGSKLLPLPSFYDAARVGELFSPDYNAIMEAVGPYRSANQVTLRRQVPKDARVCLLVIDQQVTFSLAQGELSLAPAAVEDTRRLCEFIYRYGHLITDKKVTLDSHFLWHIFHPVFWLDADGKFVKPFTAIFPQEIGSKYFVNPEVLGILFPRHKDPLGKLPWLTKCVTAYTQALAANGKPPLVVWPVHGRFGHAGHGLVPALAAAIDFHDLLRFTQTEYLSKGGRKLAENYSPFGTEVDVVSIDGRDYRLGRKAGRNVARLLKYNMLIVAGEARSHCVRAGLFDIMQAALSVDKELLRRVYILKDCTSNVQGFEAQGDAALSEFQAAGMNVVDSTTPMSAWPGVPQEILRLAA